MCEFVLFLLLSQFSLDIYECSFVCILIIVINIVFFGHSAYVYGLFMLGTFFIDVRFIWDEFSYVYVYMFF